MKNHRIFWVALIIVMAAVTMLFVKMQSSMDTKSPTLSDNGNVIEVPVDATPEEVKEALKRGEDEGKDVVIQLERPPSAEEIAALPDCDELLDALVVGPPFADKTRCRTEEGEETLLTIALEFSRKWQYVGPGEPMRRKQ